MFNTLSWNIRGIDSQGARERLKILTHQYKLPIIFLQESMATSRNIILRNTKGI